jgi:hypothetical protein
MAIFQEKSHIVGHKKNPKIRKLQFYTSIFSKHNGVKTGTISNM